MIEYQKQEPREIPFRQSDGPRQMRIPGYFYPIALSACLLSLLVPACSREEPVPAGTGEIHIPQRNETTEQLQTERTAATKSASSEDATGADSVARSELPINDINAEIQAAANSKAAWSSDVDEIARRFWQKHGADPYGDSENSAEPRMERFPISALKTGQVGIRLIEQDGGGDDSIKREWIDLWLRRDVGDEPWRVERATRSSECARGVSGEHCL